MERLNRSQIDTGLVLIFCMCEYLFDNNCVYIWNYILKH